MNTIKARGHNSGGPYSAGPAEPAASYSSAVEAAALVLGNATRNADALRAVSLHALDSTGRQLLPPSSGHQGVNQHATGCTQQQEVSPRHCDRSNDVPQAPPSAGLWQPHEVEVLVRVARDHPPGVVTPLDRLLQLLGWDQYPDPDRKLRGRVLNKFFQVRAQLDHGEDPMEKYVVERKRTRNMANTWVAWIRKAFEALPGGKGTMADICAAMEADPVISPLLDRRPHTTRRAVTKWRFMISGMLKDVKGLTKINDKRPVVYQYNPQDAVVDVGVGRRQGKKRGQPGLPFMGKKSKNAN
ncbi:hypothetical protein PLESTB_001166100 [Pleodorina starrii]|uniref:Uncharacterized protein n=1 Tax=Pleodorina starrii TaxID=330485 RepID=A0A9W6BRV8_9CHLO|nr:hypothetical protein PLESTB_001166100 [Pleodorina starrii]GLC64778.1 hypothetical protein PLESTF_000206500 [Pleodorina starrii]